MDIDLAALRALERETGHLPRRADPGDRAGPRARLPAHRRALPRTRGPSSTARPGTSSSGPGRRPRSRRPRARSTTRATRPGRAARSARSSTTPPTGFGRIAAATARQVIVQRLRDIEDDAILGDFNGREGDIVAGVIQQSPDPRHVTVDFGTVEGILPLAEQVPGEQYVHGQRLRCFVVVGQARHARPADRPVAHPPQPGQASSSPSRCPRSPTAACRDRGAGPRGRPPHQDRGALHGARPERQGLVHRPDGRPGARRDEPSCTARRSTSSTGPTTPRPSSRPHCRRPGCRRSRSSTGSCARPG